MTRAAGRIRWGVRPQLIDEFLPKLEEWMEHSHGKIRANKAHEKLFALGYAGSERTTRRTVAQVRREFKAGRVRVHRPFFLGGVTRHISPTAATWALRFQP